MKLNLANTQLGVQFRVVEFDDADILNLVQDPKTLARVTDCVNADRRQKVALVDGRFDLSEKINASGFSRLTKPVTKDGETTQVPTETEGAHIKRYVDAVATGAFTPADFTLSSGDDAAKQASAVVHLQALAFTCGDKTFEDKVVYILDINAAVRKGGTGLIPKWAMEAAANIIGNKNASAWAEKFATGYTSARGIAIDPITCGDFQQKAAKGATPEEKEAVNASNVKNLAKACVEARRQETEKMQPEFA